MHHSVIRAFRRAVGAGPSPVSSPAQALAAPAAQREVMDSVLAPVLGVAPGQVPDLAYLLFGPLARGTEVGLR